ncbi:MAG: four helix bundle protein [Bacteroidetes bacterium]|nr:four helix bundle protein [Bacteroidota bacterium]
MREYDLEDRLIGFAVDTIKLSKSIPQSISGKYLTDQIIRSSISPALNYGEAQGAESDKDFIHKMKLTLKELRETKVNLKILIEVNTQIDQDSLVELLRECDELIAITYSSIKTKKERTQK